MGNTGKQAASHPPAARTRRAAAPLQNQHTNPQIMKVRMHSDASKDTRNAFSGHFLCTLPLVDVSRLQLKV